MLTAVPLWGKDGEYMIQATYPYETFQRRNRFKGVGARWESGHWYVNEDQRQRLNIPRDVWVKTTACHVEDSRPHLVLEDKAIVGETMDAFCGFCDSHYNAIILERL